MKRSSIIIASIICVVLSSCGQMLTPQQEREKAIAAALADFDRATENSETIVMQSDILCRHNVHGTKQAEKRINEEIRKGNAGTAAEYAKNLKDFKAKRTAERAKLEKDLRAITTEVETPKKAAKLVDLSAMLQMQR